MTRRLQGVAHVHSTYSFDGRLKMPELAQFLRDRGVNFVLLSEHVESLTPESIRQFIAEAATVSDESFLIIPGIEIDALHALFYGVSAVDGWMNNEHLARQLVAAGALTVVSHPVKIRAGIPSITEQHVEGVEIWNSRHDGKVLLNPRILDYWNQLRKETGRDLIPVCGIDFHRQSDFVPLMLELDSESLDRESVFRAIRESRFHITRSGKRVPLDFRAGTLSGAYRAYCGLYRAAYDSVYSIHRAAVRSNWKLPSGVKSRLRKVF